MRKLIGTAVAVLGVALIGRSTFAGSISFSLSAPIPGTYDQSDFSTSGEDSSQDSNGYKLEPGRPSVGQSFYVGAAGAQLNSFSLKLLNYGDGGTDRTFEAQLLQFSDRTPAAGSVDPVQTILADDTATVAAGTGPSIDPSNAATAQWLTFTFSTGEQPVLVAGNTYAFALRSTDSGGGKYGDVAFETSDAYSLGNAFTIDQGQSPPDADAYGRPYDRQFDANLVVTPEPTSLSVVGLSGLTLLRRRRAKKA